MELKQCILTKNDCYKKGQKIVPKGIIVHSTGANNPTLRRYIQPDDGLIGKNKYNNDWNHSGISKCVHAMIGKDKNGKVQVYQTLPFNFACWGIGRGKKGSYNYNPAYIQFEVLEDSLKDKKYFEEAFNLAAEFCAYLMKEYDIKLSNVISHHEGFLRGYGSNHSDCDHWLKKFNKNMNDFRKLVQSKMESKPKPPKPSFEPYIVKINTDELNVRKGATVDSPIVQTVKRGETYTIVGEEKGWGKLKSGVGYISLNYTIKLDNKPVPTPNNSYLVEITADELNVRKGASTDSPIVQKVKKGEIYTIVDEEKGWGKLKSGVGYISLNYTKKVK